MNVLEIIKRATARISSAVDSGQRIIGLHRAEDGSRSLKLVELEDRIMLSATPVAAVMEPMVEQSAMLVPESGAPSQDVSTESGDAATESDTTIARELVLIDASVEDYQQLLDDLWANDDPNRDIDVVLLSSQRDGVEQITETLVQYSDQKLDAVHFISHGTDRAIKLGNDWLDAAAFTENEQLIESWSHALNEGADLLFYGCDLASDPAGQQLLQNIADATGADLAASIDDTGAVLLGGDWDLEYQIGEIDAEVVVSAFAQQEYDHLLNTFVVTSTADDGSAGTLRWAIEQANALAGVDTITFNISDPLVGGAHTITLAYDGPDGGFAPDAFPTITEAIIIDGWSEPDFAGTPIIELDGGGTGFSGLTLSSTADGSLIRGLVINGFGYGIEIQADSNDNTIVGNYIGTDVTGTVAKGNSIDGIVIQDAKRNRIGGTTLAERNILSGNENDGIWINGPSAMDNVVQGNWIGLASDGSALGNLFHGIGIENGASNNLVGGTQAGAGNRIAYNSWDGITVDSAGAVTQTGNSILGNEIFANADLGIDLGNDGADVNDLLDPDAGPNNSQNFPVLTGAFTNSNDTVAVAGSLNSSANTSFRVEFFAESGGTATYLGYRIVITDRNGNAQFVDSFSGNLAAGATITATATNLATGDTSEFSAGVAAASGIIVDTNLDTIDGGDGLTSLREAVIAANSNADFSAIFLGTEDYFLNIAGLGEELAATGDLDLREDVILVGNGATSTTIDGGGLDRVLHVLNGATAYVTDLEITSGDAIGSDGGGVRLAGSTEFIANETIISNNSATNDGGGIYNLNSLVHLHDVWVTGNTAQLGGGFANLGTAFVTQSTFSSNSAEFGGAIRNTGTELTLTNVTISGNTTTTGVGQGAGIQTSSDSYLTNVTITDNTANQSGGIHEANAATNTYVKTSIISANSAPTTPDIGGTIEDQGFNLISGVPNLESLQDNGGFAPTHALLPNSSAINNADISTSIVTDQRGYLRQSGRPDIGAIEFAADGLVGHYKFDEGIGTTAVDSSDYAHDGTLLSGPTYTAGVDGTALDFTGDFDRVEILDPADGHLDFGSGDFAVSFWMNSTSSGFGRLAGNLNAGDGLIFYTTGAGDIIFQVNSGAQTASLSSSGWFDGEWHNVVGVRSGSEFYLYIDGLRVDSTSNPLLGSIDNPDSFRIGASSGSSNEFDGLIDEVQIYNRDLAVDEIQQLSQVSTAPSAPTNLSSGIELNLDGGNDAYLITSNGDAILGGLAELTTEVRFSMDSFVDTAYLTSYATATHSDTLRIGIHSTGEIRLLVNGQRVDSTAMDYRTLADGEIHTLSVTWNSDSGSWGIFVDGELVDYGTGLQSGATLNSGSGTLVYGNEQDSVGGGFDTVSSLSATLYDIRIWDEVRSEAEIALNYQQKLDVTPVEAAAMGLVANWQMDGFNGSNEVVDIASGNNLSIGHATGIGFTTSTPVEDLHVAENATTGTSVGFVVSSDPDVTNDIVADGTFLEAGIPGTWQNYASPASIGAWQVVQNNVELLGNSYERTPLGGLSIDLNGNAPGAIEQTLATTAGTQYQLVFALSGEWTGGEAIKDLRVSADGQSTDFSISQPDNWSRTNMLWEHRTMTFTATDASTVLRFESLDGINFWGAVIGDVQVIEIPQAVSTILNNDPSLTYDAATGKYYRFVRSASDWNTALTGATSAVLNGVSGQLATIRSAYENEVVRDVVNSSGWMSTWLGATDTTSEGEFYWLNGTQDSDKFWTGGATGSATAYANFAPGEPYGDGNSTSEDYVYLNVSTGLWDDAVPSVSQGYVIEWDASEVLSSFTFSISDPSNNFEINASTGEITVAATSTLDYETATFHDVDVTVTDAAGNSYLETMRIQIDDFADSGVSQSLPGAQTTQVGTNLTFSTANGNAITVDDGTLATDTRLQVLLSVQGFNGTLTLSQTTGLSFPGGSNGSSSMVIWGTEADINAALEGMVFTPNAAYNGPADITVETQLAADLQGLYEFEDAGNVGQDTSVGVLQNGTLNGTDPAPGPSVVVDGDRGNVLSLDGFDDSVRITGRFGDPTNVTLAAWVNLTAADTNGADVISLGDNIALRLDATGVENGVALVFYDGTFRQVSTGQFLAGTGWHHVAVTFDDVNNVQVVYIDGVAVATGNFTGSLSYVHGSNTFIGAHGNGGVNWNFDGLIDDARIYTRALSAEEITAIAAESHTSSGTIPLTVIKAPPQLDLDANNSTTTGANFATTWTEGAGAVSIVDTDATLTDSDSPNLSSLTVTITNLLDDTAEVLAADTTGTSISTSYNSGTGELSLTGSDTVANYLTVLKTITYNNSSDAPSTTARSITFVANDGTNTSPVATTTVTMTAVNDTPVLSSLNDNPTYTEDSAAVVLDADVVISDIELDALNGGLGNYAGASLSIARNGGANSDDAFELNFGNGLTRYGDEIRKDGVVIGSWAVSSGQLTVGFTDSNGEIPTSADVNNILRQITYANKSDAPPASVQLDWTFDDGNAGSQGTSGALTATGSVTVNITPTNDAPVIDLDANDSSGETLGGYHTQFNVGNGPVAVADADTTVIDLDSSGITSGEIVSFTGFVDIGQEILTVGGEQFTIGTAKSVSVVLGGTTFDLVSDGTDLQITVTAGAGDPADWQTLLTGMTYDHTGTPTDGDRSFIFFVRDADGERSNIVQSTISVSANEAPTYSGTLGGTINITEQDPPTVLDSDVTITDAELSLADNFDGTTLTLQRAGSTNSTDIFSATGTLSFSAGDVILDGTTIGTYTGGTRSLTITFNADATNAWVNQAMQQIAYNNTSNNPPATLDVEWSFFDGVDATAIGTTTVNIMPVADAPILDLDNNNSSGASGGNYQTVLYSNVSSIKIADSDTTTSSPDGLTLNTLVIDNLTGFVDAGQEVITIGGTQFTIGVANSATVTYSTSSFDVDYDGTVFTISLSAGSGASSHWVGLIESMTYSNTGVRTIGDRTLDMTISDSTGNPSAAATSTITLSENDPPTFSGTLSGSVTFLEGGAPVVVDSDVTITDPELTAADNFDGATLTIKRSTARTEDVFSATGTLSFTGGNVIVGATTIGTYTNSAGTLAITFNADATNALVNSAMQQIAYSNTSIYPASSVTLQWTFSDGNTGAQGAGGARSVTNSKTIFITATTDDPPISTNDTVSVTENSTRILNTSDFGTYQDETVLQGVRITALPTAGVLEWFDGASWNAVTLNQDITRADILAGNLRFTPTADETGTPYTTIDFQVFDGAQYSVVSYTQTINVDAASVIDDTFLQGNYLEVGFSSDGTIVSDGVAPAGYVLEGEVFGVISDSDEDGWETYDGDFIYPGSPVENWGISVGGTTFVNENGGNPDITGSFSNFQSDANGQSVDWLASESGLDIKQVYSVGTDDLFIEFNIELTNTSGGDLADVYYFRDTDPDNDEFQGSPDGYSTTNTIVSQGDTDGVSMVTATQVDGSYFAIQAFGDNSRVTYGGFGNIDPIEIYNGSESLLQSGSKYDDISVSTAYYFDSIADGETVTMQIRYYFGESDGDLPTIDLDADNSSGTLDGNFTTAFVEDAGSVNIADTDATIINPEGPALDQVTVSITNLLDGAAEQLIADTTGTKITANYDSGTGVLTLTGLDSVVNYNTVLQSVQYDNAADASDTTTREITVTATFEGQSSEPVTSFVSVAATNDAPTLSSTSLTAINEDTTDPPGDTIANLFAGNFSDPDAGSAFAGVAIVASPASLDSGYWQYSTDAGTTWLDVGSVSTASALIVDTSTMVRFVPAANFNGGVPQMNVRAIDDTYSGSFTNGASRVTANVLTNGGSTPYSGSTASIGHSVIAVPDAPIASDNTVTIANSNVTATTVNEFDFVNTWVSGNVSGPRSVAAGDIDGDGDIDLAAGGYGDLDWYQNDGTGNYTAIALSGFSGYAEFVTIADLNDDGHQDIVITTWSTGEIIWYQNDGAESFSQQSLATLNQVNHFEVVDLDEDGDLDIVAADMNSGEVVWLKNDGAENFAATILQGSSGNVRSVVVRDLDTDGDLDVVYNTSTEVRWLENDGAENFTSNFVATHGNVLGLGVEDFNGDGNLDVVAVTNTSGGGILRWYENDGAESFTAHDISTMYAARYLITGDLDADGDMDFVVAEFTTNQVKAYYNDGSGNFAELIVANDLGVSNWVAAGDFNGDGLTDFASNAGGTGPVVIEQRNDTVLVGDIDNDGDTLQNVTLVSGPSFASSFTLNTDGTFSYTHDGSSNLADSFTYTVDDGTGLTSNVATVTITVENANPVVANNSGLTLLEEGTATITQALLEVTDTVSTASQITYTITQDVLNGTLRRDGTTLGVGDTFTQQDINDGLLTYQDTGIETTADSFKFTVSDGNGGTISETTFNISVTPVNDAPVLSLGPGGGTYYENATGVYIDTLATVTDSDGTDFAGGTLTTSISNNGTANDRLTIRHEGTGAGQVEVSGSNILIDGILIGTFTGGIGVSDPLVVTFIANADAADVQSVVRRVSFFNVSDDPSGLQRTVTMILTDGDGGTSSAETRTENVIPVNDTPVNILPASVSTDEDTTLAFTGANQIQISDVDAGSSEVRVQLNVGAGGLLSLGDTTGLTFDAGDGVADANMIFRGSVADINAALLTLTFEPTLNFNGSVNLTVITNDQGNTGLDPGATGDASSEQDSDTIVINVNAVNDAPVVDLNGGSAGIDHSVTFTEGDSAVSVAPSASVSDLGDNDLTSLSLLLNGMITDSSAEEITFGTVMLPYGTPANGTVTIGSTVFAYDYDGDQALDFVKSGGGVIPAANVALLIQSIQYEHTSENPTAGARSIDFVVRDSGGLDSLVATSSINVMAVNDAPVIDTNSLTIAEDGTVVLSNTDLAASDVDNTAVQLTYTVNSVTGGTFQLVSDSSVVTTFTQDDINTGNIKFVHDGNEAAPSYSLTVRDGSLSDAPSAATITFTNVNDAPVVTAPGSITVDEDTSTTFALSVSDSDVASGSMEVTLGVLNGTLTLAQTTGLTFSAGGDGSASMTFMGTIVDINSALASITYQGDLNYNGADTLSYSFSDLGNSPSTPLTDSGTVGINVNAVNDAPVIDTNSLTIAEDGTVVLSNTDLAASDVDNTAVQLTYTVNSVTGGQFELVAATGTSIASFTQQQVNDGEVQFVHDGNEAAPTYSLTVSDGALSDGPNAATITFTNVNDAPVINTNSLTISEGQTVNLANTDLSSSDVDNTATQLTYTVNSVTGGTFQLVADSSVVTTFTQDDIDTGKIKFVHDGNEAAPTYSLTVSDGVLSDGPSVATITYTNINDAPFQDGIAVGNISEGDSLTLDAGSWMDPDGGPLTFTWDLDGDNNFGEPGEPTGASPTVTWAVLESFGINDDGMYTLHVRADDGNGGVTVGTMSLTVTNTGPTANDDTGVGFITDEDTSFMTIDVRGNDTEPASGDPLVVTNLDTTGTTGSVTNNGDGTFTYDPNGLFESLNVGDSATDTFSYTISDGDGGTSTATVTITITGVNDDPVQVNNTGTVLFEGATRALTTAMLSVTDGDNTATELTYIVTQVPANGQLEFTSAPGVAITSFTQDDIDNFRVVYIHDHTNTTSDSFKFTVSDADGGAIAEQTFNFTITAIDDDPPFAVNNTGSTLAEGETLVLSRTVFEYQDTEQPATSVTFNVNVAPEVGHLELTSNPGVVITSFTQQQVNDGLVVYVHDDSQTTSDSFTFDVTDGQGNTLTNETFNLTITNLNDIPRITSNPVITVLEGDTFVIDVQAIDPDGDMLTFSIVGGVDASEFSITSSGTLAFQSAPDFTWVHPIIGGV